MKAAATATTQSGAAIVLAMGVATLAAIAATAILVSQSTWSRQNELATGHVQARTLVQAGVDWARAVLSDDRRTSSIDHAGEPWALRLEPIPVENGELAGRIDDQQGLFNLNNLVKDGKIDPTQLMYYRRLLSLLDLPPALASTVADWIDADGTPQAQGGAEDEYYRSLQPPYLTANRLMADLSELALVRGYDDGVRARLRPYVTALPRATAVNVNTASAEVLAAIIDGMSLDQARSLVAQRERTTFRDVADFSSRLPRDLTPPAAGLGVNSTYFVVSLRATIGPAEAQGQALLEREGNGWPAIIWRKYP